MNIKEDVARIVDYGAVITDSPVHDKSHSPLALMH
jgi:hypothetical protein